jgi:hypothetical protein
MHNTEDSMRQSKRSGFSDMVMRGALASLVGAPMLLCFAMQRAEAQQIPLTVAAAEAEGARFPATHGAPGPDSAYFSDQGRWRGTSERRCVQPPSQDSLSSEALRSGDFIASTHWAGQFGPKAGEEAKISWLPLHSEGQGRGMIELRAARLGAPADTLRKLVRPRAVVDFPRAGDWLVVVTRGPDWGCFRFNVAE